MGDRPATDSPRATTEQIAASDPSASSWVVASAGTGKTHVLTDRVLRLLLNGVAPERILCLTFTKAAAAEMANRLQARLANWVALDDAVLSKTLTNLIGRRPGSERMVDARRLFARVLDTQGGLKIQTIHSFCQSLLGRFPLEAGIAPHFQAMDERSAAERMEAARERMLARASSGADPALTSALDHVTALIDEDRFAGLMGALVSERIRFGRLLGEGEHGVAAAVAAARHRLGVGEGDTRESLVAESVAPGAFDELGLHRAAAALDGGTAKDCERAGRLRAWLAADEVARMALIDGDYMDLFLTKQGAPRAESGLMTKQPRDSGPAAFAALLKEQERMVALSDGLKAVAAAEATAALLHLGKALIDAYEDEKRRHAVLDYDDLIFSSRDLLSAPGVAPWVLYKLDGGLDHILVDEAQDTNPEQWDVVVALAEEFFAGSGAREPGRTMFAVGDPKQSIYSFQRADPRRFSAMEDHFAARVRDAGERWVPLSLLRSFRSTPAVLELVDAVFADEQARDGVDDRHEIRHIANRRGEAGVVEIWPTEQAEKPPGRVAWEPPLTVRRSSAASARLAERIADQAARWIRDGEPLEAQGRPIRAGDIMILVQRRSQFVEQVVRALKVRGVPVAGIDRMVLTDQLAIMDLVALGRFLLLPSDDLTLAVVLKGPLVGLDEEALFDLAYGRGKASLWAVLRRRAAERADFRAAHDFLAGLFARVDYATPFAFYAELLGAGGGRRKLVGRLGLEANDPIDEFLALAMAYERSHPPAMQAFLHWLEAGQAEIKRDLEQGRNEVRVMTVHGAKGLQAPIVFLPDTCRVSRSDAPLLWFEADGSGGEAVVWPGGKARESSLCRSARDHLKLASAQEYRRLLYVALTRAADRLYVCGWETVHGRGEGCWYDLVDAAMRRIGTPCLPGEEDGPWRYETAQEAPVKAGKDETKVIEALALPPWARVAAPPEPTPPRPLAPSRPEGEEPPIRSPLGRDDRQRFRWGNLVHRLLQTLPELPPEARAIAAQRFLNSRAADLNEAQRRALAAETLAVLDHPQFAPLFGPGSRAEVPIAGAVAGTVISGQVDRLLVRDEEVLVVDFKTNRPPPRSAEAVPVIYLRQMAAYRAALGEIYPGRPVRCALLWTDGPTLMPLDDEVMARAIT